MRTPKILVEHEGKDRRKYYTPAALTKADIEILFKPSLRPDLSRISIDIGEPGAGIIQEIGGIPGISVVKIKEHQLCLTKDSSCSWKSIQPKALAALKKTFGAQAEKIGVIYPEKTPRSEKIQVGFVQQLRLILSPA